MKNLPRIIYVKWAGEDDCMYLDAGDNVHGEDGEIIGTYKLISVGKVCVQDTIIINDKPVK